MTYNLLTKYVKCLSEMEMNLMAYECILRYHLIENNSGLSRVLALQVLCTVLGNDCSVGVYMKIYIISKIPGAILMKHHSSLKFSKYS